MQRHEDSGFSSIPSRKKTQETFFDFATTLPVDNRQQFESIPRLTERIASPIQGKNRTRFAMLSPMAGIRGKSGPPANQNAFKHGLVGITQRRANGALTPEVQTIREDILAG